MGVRKNRVGETYTSLQKEEYKITEDFGWDNCTIQFENGSVVKNIHYSNIKRGKVENPMTPSVCNIGYIGVGQHRPKDNIRRYNCWVDMLKRCYSQRLQKIQPTYKDVTVCEEWHNFQNFAEWYNNNHTEGYYLDKDIICKSCKIYSYETCAFVPSEINNFFLFRANERGKYKLGVKFQNGKFASGINKGGKKIFLGYFDTEDEAHNAYIVEKTNHAKTLAKKYKNKVNKNIIKALLIFNIKNYEDN